MAEGIKHPHDLMVRAVLSDLADARSFLQNHLSKEVSQALNWSTLKLLEGSFVDEDLRGRAGVGGLTVNRGCIRNIYRAEENTCLSIWLRSPPRTVSLWVGPTWLLPLLIGLLPSIAYAFFMGTGGISTVPYTSNWALD